MRPSLTLVQRIRRAGATATDADEAERWIAFCLHYWAFLMTENDVKRLKNIGQEAKRLSDSCCGGR
jgi:hypothetical protein